ncbi:kinetochore complex Sim4 subunit Fta1-domain-containing protein [Phialemonium atrogriseum]|uniref:Kinetochore complex Sim4 subunit Fta1-domain-containing protein n=1 Tax=Phialemonium atrogriseum TaxID=1093897 RepID=A0AAJ0BZG6_9PEZI|nr:kinetochore complex Sim4 subunit Fta1-domain-containing protein [Phialemonium atrogriseum]KAK1765964.1 kinetochore complex Sim4 subunit Fta1-domain-containing protein [Phialemonium atrogriseum]
MARRGRRKRFSTGRTRRPRPDSPAPSDNSQPTASSSSSFASSPPPPPFYNTTFTTHRVSPLHLGANPLTAARLRALANRLRDVVVGDVVRGVEVGLEGAGDDDAAAAMPRAGALELVDIRWVAVGAVLGGGLDDDADTDGAGGGRRRRSPSRELGNDAREAEVVGWHGHGLGRLARARALHVELRYENSLCTALLLPALGVEGDGAAAAGAADGYAGPFVEMPLLLMRMPALLRPVVIDFLCTTFDCRVSPLRLGTRSLVAGLERWMGASAGGVVDKDVVLGLGFSAPVVEAGDMGKDEAAEAGRAGLGLRAVDVIVSAAELDRFCSAGERVAGEPAREASRRKAGWEEDPAKRRRLAGRLYEEGWEWRRGGDGGGGRTGAGQPFVEALGWYLDRHLALNLFDPRVRVTRIACGGFVMSEGRVKIFAPERGGDAAMSVERRMGAVVDLLGILLEKAAGRAAEEVTPV